MDLFKVTTDEISAGIVIDYDAQQEMVAELNRFNAERQLNPQLKPPYDNYGGWYDMYLDDSSLEPVSDMQTYADFITDALYDEYNVPDVQFKTIEPLDVPALDVLPRVIPDTSFQTRPSTLAPQTIPDLVPLEETTIPQDVIDELVAFASAPTFKETADQADTINAYATQYGTLPLDVVTLTDTRVESLRGTLNQLDITARAFNDPKSPTGQMVVSEFLDAIAKAKQVINNDPITEQDVRTAFSQLQDAGSVLQGWLLTRWDIYGGTPENAPKEKYRSSGGALTALQAMF